ncbi:cholinephosphotransferase-like protein [Eremomyces bilateralis CBS 781.70]|uniref:Cholinephosphotransferase-like protein n=1 Tax=Eremomyces bilateralis CBS 781.70 TaxID=1392243 RepID=A0A6G1FSK2_9PEZI|nr:cholinephosphotransferase-like protein [Eremomyces bilateralis CBS 781.70]KAF1808716.1 cholinephosphotransferase-like protein [Eremomyces bilateralis CBS 781.70]
MSSSDRASRGRAKWDPLSDESLAPLREYKYTSVDKSPFSYYVLRPYWNFVVELLPLWLAPNLVTLLGFMAILGNVGLLGMYIPDLIGPASPWLYYSFAAGVWFYSTMDNIDGKQARRTGTSSPLGELFDHGIDSLNCTLASLLETAAMGFGATRPGAFTALVPCLPMFFSTWETYHTHTLYLGYFNGPTEGLTIAALMMVFSGYFGPGIWSEPLAGFVPVLGSLLGETTSVKDVWVPFLTIMFLVSHLPACIYHVVQARRAKNLPVWTTFLEWFPMGVFWAGCLSWLQSPHSSLLRENHLILFCLTMSLVFGRMTTKIILAHLTRQPFPMWTAMLTPLIAGAAIGNLPLVGLPPIRPDLELWYLRAYFLYASVVYGRWAVLVIEAFCRFLGIKALTVPPEKVQAAKAKQESANGYASPPANRQRSRGSVRRREV